MGKHAVVVAVGMAGVVGCGSGSATPVTPPRVTTAPLDAAPASDDAPPDLATAAVAPLAAAGCRWDLDAWSGQVSLTPDGPPFAAVIASPASVAASAAGAEAMFVEVNDGGVRLAAWLHHPALFLAKATPLADVVYPKPKVPLRWRGLGRAGALEVSLDVRATMAAPTTARAELTCDRLAAVPVAFGAMIAAPSRRSPSITSAATPIAPGPVRGGDQQLRADLAVVAGRGRGGFTAVFVDGGDHVVAGWVLSSMLSPGDGPRPYAIEATATTRDAKVTIPSPHNVACAREVPLFIEHGGVRAPIGALVAGSPYPDRRAAPDPRGFVEVAPWGRQWLVPEPGARLVARVADLDACRAP